MPTPLGQRELLEAMGERSVGRSSLVVSVLDLDRDLARGLAGEEWKAARAACPASVLRMGHGVWDATAALDDESSLLGVLIVDGLLWRDVALFDRHLLELLGPGDVLQLPVADGDAWFGGDRTRLIAVENTQLVVLGESFIRAAGRWPSLLLNVAQRLEAQRERLAVQGLIAHLPRAEDRVLLVLRHLAAHHGRVTPEGIVLPLPLTHELLGQLTASRRSTVTLAASSLQSQGLIRRLEDRSWLLTSLAERAIEAIAAAPTRENGLGDTHLLRSRIDQTLEKARALHAEAHQIIAHHRRDGRR